MAPFVYWVSVEFDDDTCVRDADRAFYLGLDIAMETFMAEHKGGARAPVLVLSAVPDQTVQVRLRESVVPVQRASASPEVRKLRFSRFLVTSTTESRCSVNFKQSQS